MCGITGWIAYGRDMARQTGTICAMTATMACRGPDAEGVWNRGPAALGHRRLAVIDLPGGTQPMTGRNAVLVYSGETYNFEELRAELRANGHAFTTDSDTEVVLRGYREWGEHLPEHLNGIFACAVWDEPRQRLLLVRDRMGVKPLYYQPTADGVLFGS